MERDLLKKLNSIYEGWTKEFRFNSQKRYRFDYANLKLKIAVEIEGGIWTKGHTNPKIYIKDMRKYNLAQLLGWIVLRYGKEEIKNIEKDVKKAIEMRKKDLR